MFHWPPWPGTVWSRYCTRRSSSPRSAVSADGLQEVVRALQLVEIRCVVLGKLEFLHARGLLCGRWQQVQGREEPAAARLLLAGDLSVVDALIVDRTNWGVSRRLHGTPGISLSKIARSSSSSKDPTTNRTAARKRRRFISSGTLRRVSGTLRQSCGCVWLSRFERHTVIAQLARTSERVPSMPVAQGVR